MGEDKPGLPKYFGITGEPCGLAVLETVLIKLPLGYFWHVIDYDRPMHKGAVAYAFITEADMLEHRRAIGNLCIADVTDDPDEPWVHTLNEESLVAATEKLRISGQRILLAQNAFISGWFAALSSNLEPIKGLTINYVFEEDNRRWYCSSLRMTLSERKFAIIGCVCDEHFPALSDKMAKAISGGRWWMPH